VVTAAETRDTLSALLVDVHITGLTSQPLLIEAVQEGATVIAKCWTGIGLVAESVLSVVILKVRVSSSVDTGTHEGHELVTSLMHHEGTDLALIALFSKAPDEIFTVATEDRLFEKSRDELVVLHH